jgi:hypothetical protein
VTEKKIKSRIKTLRKLEPEAIIRVMAFMSYNPSIGRVLQKKGVEVFQGMAVAKVRRLTRIQTMADFDRFHHRWIKQLRKRIKRNDQKKCSVGQAQKAINVFLKLYVDWAHLPDSRTARRLLPYLHVPLDSILMRQTAREFHALFSRKIQPLRVKNSTYSLSKIAAKEYRAWQNLFRELYSSKPILFDVIWATNR